VKWTNGAGQEVSTTASLDVVVENDTELTAVFALKPKCIVSASANNDAWGSVTGSGSYFVNATATLTATPTGDALFVQWTNSEGDSVSVENPLAVTVTANTTLIAVFAEARDLDLSSDATLSNLTVSAGTLSPAFHPDTLNYAVSVENATGSITITPTPADPSATVEGGGDTTLQVGKTVITIVVTAEDGVVTQSYTITVTREATPSAVSSLTLGNLTIYPNPVTTGVLTIENGDLKAGDKVEVYAISGSRVATFEVSAGAQTVINVSYLPKGAYIIKLGNRAAKAVIN
jgi:hypothetical protein